MSLRKRISKIVKRVPKDKQGNPENPAEILRDEILKSSKKLNEEVLEVENLLKGLVE